MRGQSAFRMGCFVFQNVMIKFNKQLEGWGGGISRGAMVGTERENFGHLETLDGRKRQFHTRIERTFVKK